jgi:hypothetical protein
MERVAFSAIPYHLARLLAAAVLSWVVLLGEFVVTLMTKWKWLGVLVITPGFVIRDALVRLGWAKPPATGGHMPDFGPAIAFNWTLDFAVIFALLYVYPNFLRSFFPNREKT